MDKNITLLSTVVAPTFQSGELSIIAVGKEELPDLLGRVNRNLCGHPITNKVLREVCPTLPENKREFWDGHSLALAARPKGGVRKSSEDGDTQVTLDDLEFALVEYERG